MLKGNCRKKNLTTCERKTSSYKPAFTNSSHFPKRNYVNFYFHENEAGLDKEIKHLELKRETCLKQFS